MFPRFVRKSFLTTSLLCSTWSSGRVCREGHGERWITAGIQRGLRPIFLCNPICTGRMCHWKCQGYFWILRSRGNVENFGISAALLGSGRREKLFILGMAWRELGATPSPIPRLRNPKSCSFLAFCSPWVIHIYIYIWGFPVAASQDFCSSKLPELPPAGIRSHWEFGIGNSESQAVLLSCQTPTWNLLGSIGKLKGQTSGMQEFLELEHF